MTTLPAAGYFTSPRTNLEAKQGQDDVLAYIRQMPGGAAETELTIAAGAITPTGALHVVDTEGDTAADDLTNIAATSQPGGRILLLEGADAARVTTVKHGAGGAGQIILADGADYALDAVGKRLALVLIGADWYELWRYYGPDKAGARANLGVPALVSPCNVLAPHAGLVVQRASVSTVDVDADGILLRNADGEVTWIENVNLTVDMAASGANGLDTGVEAALTWYYVHAIYDATLSSRAALLSLSATSPTLPSGYTYAGLVGAAYNDGVGNMRPFHQRGTRVVAGRTTPLNAGTAATFTAISLALHVPAIATVVYGDMSIDKSAGTAETRMDIASDGSGSTPLYGVATARSPAGVGANTSISRGAALLLTTAQQVKYLVSGANARGYLFMQGYEF